MFNTNNFNCIPLCIKERYLRSKSLSSLSGKILPKKTFFPTGANRFKSYNSPIAPQYRTIKANS